MRAAGLLAAAVATMAVSPLVAADCSFCRYTAWNCTEEAAANESSVQSALSSGKTDLRKEPVAPGAQPLQVCNAEGRIQVDDVFCDGSECSCADGKHCACLLLGCQNIFQARSRKRCIGSSAIQQRFQRCAVAHSLTSQTKANLHDDWVYFKDPKRCESEDCKVVSHFHQCNAVQCGRLIVAWKENSTNYRFVVDGSRASDMAAGTFLFRAPTSGGNICSTVSSIQIPDCYAPQTRNQKNGTCDGIYLQADTKLQAAGDSDSLSKLSWPLYLAVVGSVAAAFASVASVVFVVRRHRRERQQEERGLLPDDPPECSTPDASSSALRGAPTDIRKRPLSPRSTESS